MRFKRCALLFGPFILMLRSQQSCRTYSGSVQIIFIELRLGAQFYSQDAESWDEFVAVIASYLLKDRRTFPESLLVWNAPQSRPRYIRSR